VTSLRANHVTAIAGAALLPVGVIRLAGAHLVVPAIACAILAALLVWLARTCRTQQSERPR
jgi:membrane protein implicated in regulation of membrane protease activity